MSDQSINDIEEHTEKCVSSGFDAGYDAAISLLNDFSKAVSPKSSKLLTEISERMNRGPVKDAVRKKFLQALEFEFGDVEEK
jgi:hypothetical protein